MKNLNKPLGQVSKLLAALSIGLFSMAAFAQAPTPAPSETPPPAPQPAPPAAEPAVPPAASAKGPGETHKMFDCGKIDDAAKKAKCEVREESMKKCKDMQGDADRKACMKEAMSKK